MAKILSRLRKPSKPLEVWEGEPKTVLFLVGPGHTGSTLLNFILGTHSRVFGAGELNKLHSDEWMRKHKVHSTKCSVCVECAFWPEFLSKNTFKDTYLGLLSFVKADVIVDSSKSSSWAAAQGAIERGVNYRYVRLI